MTRQKEREALFALLYEMSFSKPEEAENVLATEQVEREYNTEYILSGYRGAIEHLSEIDQIIEQYSHGWKINRISKVTLALLRLGLYEMFYTNVGYAIVINEAVNLAKTYDHEKAPAFINGILNRAAEEKGLKS
jgi:N utilization substance protein B